MGEVKNGPLGDQIGRIFGFGDCLLRAVFLITEVAEIFGLIFSQ
jgi:hypothetical protein